MSKFSLPFGIGGAVYAERKRQGVTQRALARRVGLSVPTVRQVERGGGRLSSLWSVLDVLAVRFVGRNLPKGEHLGRQLALLRKRRGVSQRELAGMVGVSVPTIWKLERFVLGRAETLGAVVGVLGAGAYLARDGDTKRFFVTTGLSSVHHGWCTPATLLEQLYEVFGEFDLDPCSPTGERRGAPVWARVRFTPADNGLVLPWHGVVFVNPPYGRALRQWLAKAYGEVEAGRARVVVGLVPVRTETHWWHDYIAGAADVFMLRGRLCFEGIESNGSGKRNGAPFPSAVVVWGADRGEVEGLKGVLVGAWYVPAVG